MMLKAFTIGQNGDACLCILMVEELDVSVKVSRSTGASSLEKLHNTGKLACAMMRGAIVMFVGCSLGK